MAVDQHLPIIPITINGPFDVLPIGSLNLHRHPLEMVIHEPVSTDGVESTHKGLQQMADMTQEIKGIFFPLQGDQLMKLRLS